MKRSAFVALAAVMALLVTTAPAAAATSATVVVSQHTTDTDFASAPTTQNLTVEGTGTSASLNLSSASSYDVVDDSGDGTYDAQATFAGDTGGGDVYEIEAKTVPDSTGTVDEISVDISSTGGSDYGVTVDVYAVVGEDPDAVYGEGTKVAEWDPDWSTGEQTISLDTPVDVTSGQTVTFEFVTRSSDGDGTNDRLLIHRDDASHLTDWRSSQGVVRDGALALSYDISGTPSSGKYVSQTHSVTDPVQAAVDVELQNAEATIAIQDADTGNNITTTTVTNTANHTVDLSGTSATNLQTVVWFEALSGTTRAKLHDESILINATSPYIDNGSASPSGGTTIDTKTATLEIDASDVDFPVDGDTLTATAYNASNDAQIGSDTLNSNGTASVSWTPQTGSNSYYWIVEDSYGLSTTSETFNFQVPGTLSVYNESAPSQLVDGNVNLTARFFVNGSEKVIEKPVTGGTVELTGLPADETIVITVNEENDEYYFRRITITSIVDQQEIYLLPQSVNGLRVVFELDSPSGSFSPEQTRLYVEKPITKDFDSDGTNETEYKTVSGDYFGAGGRFPTYLIEDERYRLRVRTDGGEERLLGSYTAYTSKTEPLQVSRIVPPGDETRNATLYANLDTYDESPALAVRFRDPDDESDKVTYRVLQNNSVIVPNTTSTASSFAHIYNVSGNGTTNYTVEYWVYYPDRVESNTIQLGDPEGIADRLNMDAQVLSLASWVMILATMGLVVIYDADLAPFAGTAVATGLALIGTVGIPLPLLGVAGAISVLNLFGGREP